MSRNLAAIVRHVQAGGPGTLLAALNELRYDVRLFGPVDEPMDLDVAARADLLIVLGGPMGVYEVDAHPFLATSLATVRERLRHDRPLLGICLGGQLMATALGAPARPGAAGREIGWKPVSLADEALGHALSEFHALPVLHWHGDTFDLPRGATRLASSDQYANQAFSFGRRALALQFHVEVDAAMLDAWASHATKGGSDIDVEALRLQTAQHACALREGTKRFLARWLLDVISPS